MFDRNSYMRNYYNMNKEKVRFFYMNWKNNNKEQRSLYNQKYFKTLRGKLVRSAYAHRRRLQNKGLTKELLQQVYEENIKNFGTLTCELCFKPIVFGSDTLEHFIPLSRGGDNERTNLGIAHALCNYKKNNKTLEEYKSWL